MAHLLNLSPNHPLTSIVTAFIPGQAIAISPLDRWNNLLMVSPLLSIQTVDRIIFVKLESGYVTPSLTSSPSFSLHLEQNPNSSQGPVRLSWIWALPASANWPPRPLAYGLQTQRPSCVP